MKLRARTILRNLLLEVETSDIDLGVRLLKAKAAEYRDQIGRVSIKGPILLTQNLKPVSWETKK